MADVTIKKFDELDSYKDEQGKSGAFLYAGKGLGVKAWGMNILRLPPDWKDYPEHDHVEDGQEEVYITLRGSATLQIGGSTWPLEPGTLVRVGPKEKRKIVPGRDGVTLLALGGTPGKSYTLPDWIK